MKTARNLPVRRGAAAQPPTAGHKGEKHLHRGRASAAVICAAAVGAALATVADGHVRQPLRLELGNDVTSDLFRDASKNCLEIVL